MFAGIKVVAESFSWIRFFTCGGTGRAVLASQTVDLPGILYGFFVASGIRRQTSNSLRNDMLWYRDTHSNQSIFGELLGFMGKVYGYRSKRLFSHVGMTYTGSTQVAELSRICFGTCGCDTNMCTYHTLDRLWLMCKNNQKYTYTQIRAGICVEHLDSSTGLFSSKLAANLAPFVQRGFGDFDCAASSENKIR